MSDEPNKCDTIESRWQPVAVVSLEKPKRPRSAMRTTAFFCLNLLAAYVPVVVAFIMDQPKESPVLSFVSWPVLVVGLIATSYDMNETGRWFFLAAFAFILLLFCASAALRNSRKAWVAIPSIVFMYSLLQGMLALTVINHIGGE